MAQILNKELSCVSVVRFDKVRCRVTIFDDLILTLDLDNPVLDTAAGCPLCYRFFSCEYKRIAPRLCLLYAAPCLCTASVDTFCKIHNKLVVVPPVLLDLLKLVCTKWHVVKEASCPCHCVCCHVHCTRQASHLRIAPYTRCNHKRYCLTKSGSTPQMQYER